MSHKACCVNKRRLYTAVVSPACSRECFCVIRPAGWLSPGLQNYFSSYCHYFIYSGYTLRELLSFALDAKHVHRLAFISAVRSLMEVDHV